MQQQTQSYFMITWYTAQCFQKNMYVVSVLVQAWIKTFHNNDSATDSSLQKDLNARDIY